MVINLVLFNFCFTDNGHVVLVSAGTRHFSGIDLWDQEFDQDVRKEIEKHWSSKILHEGFEENSQKEKFYVLSMFPYPSGFLHMGHVRVYTISDVLARYFRLTGKNVIHPMGWDAFGLPAENAALDKGLNPEEWTQKNIADMKAVMEELNLSFDWDREFATCDSDYYKWTQFLFLKLYERGIIYRKLAFVNWDPVDKTVLANEQVGADGRSWRSGAFVEKKAMRQWFVRTTRFSKNLSDGLSESFLKGWKDIIKIQKHWIGKVEGTTIDFEIVDHVSEGEQRAMPIWMKFPEFVDKAKFVAVKKQSFWTFGCEVEGLMPYSVKNPFTGEILPVYLTDAIVFPEGADCHLGIPDLSDADKIFADSMKIPYSQGLQKWARKEELLELREKICAEARERGIGGFPTSSKLKDWLISRQRYWGTPIPIVHCENCGAQPVPEKDLPVVLPKVKSIVKGKNTLREEKDWLLTSCPKCGQEATRETDTMDTFVDSSWYYLRYLDPDNNTAAFDVEKVKKLMPVDVYVGGKEHAALHLYYARFMSHFLHSVGLVPNPEPFRQLLCQGMVKNFTYKSLSTGKYVSPDLVDVINGSPVHKESNETLVGEWEKMSKSKCNSVEPKDLLKKYGVDTTRLVILSGSSPKSDVEWNENRFIDILSWQKRLWLTVRNFIQLRSRLLTEFVETEEFKKLDFFIFDSRNFYLKKITRCMESSHDVATAIAKLQGLTGSLRKCNDDVITFSLHFERALALHLILLAPMAPYFASELWAGFTKAPCRLCNNGEILWDSPVFQQPWPQVDENYQPKSEMVKSIVNIHTYKSTSERKKEKRKKKMAAASEKNTEVVDD